MIKFPVSAPKKRVIKALKSLGFQIVREREHIAMSRENADGTKTTDEGSIIAVSDDKGSNWKFVRAKTKEAIRPLFPKVIDKLTFSESVLK